MLFKLWRKHVTLPRRLKRCADHGFVADPAMDELCERFDESLRNMWYAKADQAGNYLVDPLTPEPETFQNRIDELVAEQKAIQEEGGQKLKAYLSPYFRIVERHKAGE